MTDTSVRDLMDPKTHWQHVYGAKLPTEVSWYQREPTRSLDLLAETGVASESTISAVGGRTR